MSESDSVRGAQLREQPPVKLTVFLQTYNHAPYVAEAIQSVLTQETDFPYELLVGDDCSTDGTRAIVEGFQKRDPDRIRLLFPSSNLGFGGNALFDRALRDVRGEYVAMLDGDDYWLFSRKLQHQVDFLKRNPSFSLSFHNAYELRDGSRRDYVRSFPFAVKTTYGVEDFLVYNVVPGSSIVARNSVVDALPPGFEQIPAPDWLFNVLHAQRGRIAFIDEFWSVRRVHPDGLFSGKTLEEMCELDIATLANLERYVGPEHVGQLRSTRALNHYRLLCRKLEQGRYEDALRHALKCLAVSRLRGGIIPRRRAIRLAARAAQRAIVARAG
jgi:glycosyltransferase involved in cell wall biosynthesis